MFDREIKKIKETKVIPVVKIQEKEAALKLAEALTESGIKAIEITFRTRDGDEGLKKIAGCIKAVKTEYPDLFVGAGTVISSILAEKAMDAGAQFLVSPGYNPKTVRWCTEHSAPFFPGVCTPGEIEQALEEGLHFLKLFPAETAGGIKYLKALSGPFPQVEFIPTGGINISNFREYLCCPNVGAAGGSWMCPESLIKEKKWNEIKNLCKETVSCLEGIKNC